MAGNGVAERSCGLPLRRPPSVHRSFDREGVEQRDGVLTAVAGEVSVVVVDHRDARPHEARDREHRDAGSQREGRLGVTQVVEMTERLDTGSCLSGFPVTATEAAEVDTTFPRVREQDRVLR